MSSTNTSRSRSTVANTCTGTDGGAAGRADVDASPVRDSGVDEFTGNTAVGSPLSGEPQMESVDPLHTRPVTPRKRHPEASSSSAASGRFHVVVPTFVGGLRVVAANGSVLGIYHEEHHPTPGPELLGEALCGRRQERAVVGEETGANGGEAVSVGDVLDRARRELLEYFSGQRRAFDVPLQVEGTAFQKEVWRVLAGIPFGERWTYREVAAVLGNSGMGRAVGAAVRANPLSIAIPGHRVVGSSGKVIGYAAGVEVKAALLDFERSLCPPAEPARTAPVDGSVDGLVVGSVGERPSPPRRRPADGQGDAHAGS